MQKKKEKNSTHRIFTTVLLRKQQKIEGTSRGDHQINFRDGRKRLTSLIHNEV